MIRGLVTDLYSAVVGKDGFDMLRYLLPQLVFFSLSKITRSSLPFPCIFAVNLCFIMLEEGLKKFVLFQIFLSKYSFFLCPLHCLL